MWASPAAADPPTRTEFTVPLSGPHFLTGFCGTQIEQDGGAYIASTHYGDGRLIEHVRVDLVLTANGNIAYEGATFTVVVDPSAGTVTQTGTLINIRAPAAGLLMQEVGRVVLGLATFDPLFAVGALDDSGRRARAGLFVLRDRPLSSRFRAVRGAKRAASWASTVWVARASKAARNKAEPASE
jgi:hypothetical protein